MDLLLIRLKSWHVLICLHCCGRLRQNGEIQTSRTLLFCLFFTQLWGWEHWGGGGTANIAIQFSAPSAFWELRGEFWCLILRGYCHRRVDRQDAKSSGCSCPPGPGMDLEPRGAPCSPRPSLPHTGKLWSDPGKWFCYFVHIFNPVLWPCVVVLSSQVEIH